MGSSSPKPPKAPDPVNPLGPIALQYLLGNANTQGPYSRTSLYSNGEELSQSQISAALAAAFQNPNSPDWSALAPILSAERRTVEDPRVQAMRERQQGTDLWRNDIFRGYLNNFGVERSVLPGQENELMSEPTPGGAGIPGLPQLTMRDLPSIPEIATYDPGRYGNYFRQRRIG